MVRGAGVDRDVPFCISLPYYVAAIVSPGLSPCAWWSGKLGKVALDL